MLKPLNVSVCPKNVLTRDHIILDAYSKDERIFMLKTVYLLIIESKDDTQYCEGGSSNCYFRKKEKNCRSN